MMFSVETADLRATLYLETSGKKPFNVSVQAVFSSGGVFMRFFYPFLGTSLFVLCVIGFGVVSVGHSQTIRDWNNTTDSEAWYQFGSNWDGGNAPSDAEKARFNQAASYEVWWDATTASTTPEVGFFDVLQGDVNFLNKETSTQHLYSINGGGSFSDFTISGASTSATLSGLHFKSLGGGQIVNGATLILEGSHPMGSRLTAAGSAGFDVSGALNVNSGAVFDNTFGYLGYESDSTGVATVSGNGSRWDNSRFLFVGYQGDGTLNVLGGGVVSNELGSIGDWASSTGVVTVSGIGSQWNNSLGLGVGSVGSGTLNVLEGGLVSNGGNCTIGYSGTGVATVSGIGSQWINSSWLTVGGDNDGTLEVLDGGVVSNSEGFIGKFSGSTSVATVRGSGSQWNNSSDLSVGTLGSGTLNVEAGGVVNNTTGFIGHINGSTGLVTVTGSGSQWNHSVDLAIGGGMGAAGGTGLLTIADGGLVDVSGTTKLWSTGTLTLDGGSLITGTFENSGTFRTTSGTNTISGDVYNDGGFQVDSGSDLVLMDDVFGSGAFTGGGDVTFHGGFRPGNSPATIEFGGDVLLDATSSTFIEIGGQADAEFDRLVLSNIDAILKINDGAALDVQLINGFELGFNQEFIFCNIAGSNLPVGTFSDLGEGDLVGSFSGTDLFISYAAGSGNDISLFTAVPEPSTFLVAAIALGALGTCRRPRKGIFA